MIYTPNSDPNYYKSHYTNCGSFALNIKEWYSPDEDFVELYGDIEDWINSMWDCCCQDVFEISDYFANKLVDIILEDFEDLAYEFDYSEKALKPNEELIAFRAFCDIEGAWDFHFKVYRDGRWQEKHGSGPVEDCSLDDWTHGYFDYISSTHYFIRTVK